jgi:SET and MYND domain-containing protein
MMGMHSADQGTVIGVALDPFASLINHSCDPNAFVFCEGNQLRARSLRPIVAGDEITFSYTNETYDYIFRQKQLKSKYFFTCKCKPCSKVS